MISFTKEAMEKLRIGAASFVKDNKTGLVIPQLRDVATGRFMEHGKLIQNAKAIPELMMEIGVNALPGLIAIARIISNYDISKQLNRS